MATTRLRTKGVNPKRMTDKQVLFAHEYMVDLNATEAARRAGYGSPAKAGARLVSNEVVEGYISTLRKQKLAKVDLQAEDVLRELAYIVKRDPLDLCDEDGKIDVECIGKLPERIRKPIDSIKQREHYDSEGNFTGTTTELRLASKLGAIELAMKHLGMLEGTKHEHKHLHLSFDELYGIPTEPDPIEQRISNV